MSYEGYVEFVCKKGNLFSYDCYDVNIEMPEKNWKCPSCGEEMAWRRGVDQTNGIAYGDPHTLEAVKVGILKIKTPAHHCTCDKCGTKHVSAREVFEIPTKESEKAAIAAYLKAYAESPIEMFGIVRLVTPQPGVEAGQEGTVVEIYNGGEAYSVEFPSPEFNLNPAILTLKAGDIVKC